MKKEYDLANAERGKFYHPGFTQNIPNYLETDNMAFVEQIAEKVETVSGFQVVKNESTTCLLGSLPVTTLECMHD